MLELISMIMAALLVGVGGFSVACKIVKEWSGCSEEEAARKVRNLVTGKVTVPLASDPGFYNELCQALQNIIGEKRYGELAKLDAALRAARRTPVIACSTNSGLPCIDITVQPKDDTEKQTIEVVMIGITKNHLATRGFRTEVLADWKRRMDINYPYLEIRYPGSGEEQKLIVNTIIRTGSAVVDVNNPLTDDTEEEDLADDTEEDD